jgi:hypothetical protein
VHHPRSFLTLEQKRRHDGFTDRLREEEKKEQEGGAPLSSIITNTAPFFVCVRAHNAHGRFAIPRGQRERERNHRASSFASVDRQQRGVKEKELCTQRDDDDFLGSTQNARACMLDSRVCVCVCAS